MLGKQTKNGNSENLELVPSLCTKLSWNFLLLSCCSAHAGNQQYITCMSIYYWDMTCHGYASFYQPLNWENRVLLAAFWDKLLISTVHCSVCGDGPLWAQHHTLASFDVAIPSLSERKKLSWIDWTIKIFPSMRWALLCWFSTRSLRFQASHHATYCVWLSLKLFRPAVQMFSPSARACAAATCCVGLRACSSRSLNI